jgi:hypothetical protein
MFTMAVGHRGRANPERWMRKKAARYAAVLGILLLTSIAVNTLTILADRNLRQWSLTAGDCSVVTDRAGQSAC